MMKNECRTIKNVHGIDHENVTEALRNIQSAEPLPLSPKCHFIAKMREVVAAQLAQAS